VKKDTSKILKEVVPLILIAVMVIMAFGLFKAPCLGDKLPSHWNAAGEVDGYSSKGFALFFYPAITLLVYLLMTFIPRIDPFRKNYKKFEKPYYFLRLILVVFFFLLYFYMIFAAIGFKSNIMYFMVPMLSLFFIAMGAIVSKVKRNYFVGFRTPWTLQSDEVWVKTHKFGGKAFMVAGIIGFFGVFFGEKAIIVFIVPIIIGALAPLVYSYFIYKKLGLFKEGKNKK